MEKGLHEKLMTELYAMHSDLKEMTENDRSVEVYQVANNIAGKLAKLEMNQMIYHKQRMEIPNMAEMERV